MECKTTTHKSFTITREMVEKIERAALAGGGEAPAIEVHFLNADGKVDLKVAVVPTYVIDHLCSEG